MSWLLAFMIFYVVCVILFILYWTFMEFIAEAKHREFKIKNLLEGPETLVHAMKRVSGNKYIKNLKIK